jgi:phosphatidylethanolamine-binding protein (PEBP) family uncharacterized protein
MAQRTGAERLIAPRAKVASAGFVLALAAAALLAVSGCGGGSDASSAAQTASTPGSSASAGSASGAARKAKQGSASGADGSGKSSSGAPSAAEAALNPSPGPSAPTGAKSGSGAKHDSHVTLPKGPTEPAPTPAEVAHATVADMALQSPAIPPSGSIGSIPATYTCDGKDSWPTLRWQGVPQGTAELALFAMNVQPVEEKLFFDWAVAGLDPSLEGIEAAKLPQGAIVGQNSFGKTGYSICPPEGETYMFALYALPQRLSAKKGFDPGDLRKEVLQVSGDVGLLPAAYVRG